MAGGIQRKAAKIIGVSPGFLSGKLEKFKLRDRYIAIKKNAGKLAAVKISQ